MESESNNLQTKTGDSAYSKSCSNSNSRRSASSKSGNSGSNSSRSSGYCGAVNSVAGSVETVQVPNKRNKDKEHKKKKSKSINTNLGITTTSTLTENRNKPFTDETSNIKMGLDILPIHSLDIKEAANHNQESCSTALIANVPVIDKSSTKDKCSAIKKCNVEKNENNILETSQIEQADNFTFDNYIDCVNKIDINQPEAGFCCVISMYDGVVLYTTPSLTTALGFPVDMWLGRSFIDFVHPKDRDTFSNQIATGVAIPLIDSTDKKKDVKSSLFVSLRRYRGLKISGFGVIETPVSYQAYHLSVTVRHISESVNLNEFDSNRDAFLIIVAVPVNSSYKIPDEIRKLKKFCMRHTAACIFSHVDADVVRNFGYFPQDMLGKSVFDFYHPEDLPFLKEVYESVMSNCQIAGSVYRSKPYRFAAQNGDFVMIETEWSCFINPWSRKLEFVLGLHRVLQGPSNPDVFEITKVNGNIHISEEVVNEARLIREEILLLLNKELMRPSQVVRHEVSKRCKDLANFMETIMTDVSNSNLKSNSSKNQVVSISERDSVMLGEISPHHDYYDRESSSEETSPSYNQLNYHENIHRFFKSKPLTTPSDASAKRQIVVPNTNVKNQNVSVQKCNQKCLSPVQNSANSGSGSAGNLSSGSNPNIESTVASGISNCSFKPPHLTEELLIRHNEDMEKIMRQRHREHRSNVKADREYKKSHKCGKLTTYDKIDKKYGTTQGIKRTGSGSRAGDNYKVSKHTHQNVFVNTDDVHVSKNNRVFKYISEANGTHDTNCIDNGYIQGVNDVNLLSSFPVSINNLSNTVNYGVNSIVNASGNMQSGMFPAYYIPAQFGAAPREYAESSRSPNLQVQYMPSMMYNCNTLYPTSSMFCPPMTMVPFSMPQPVHPIIPAVRPRMSTMDSVAPTDHNPSPFSNSFGNKCQRPPPQATSVKAEPGSAIGSVTTASLLNRAMSEYSRKDFGLPSVCSPGSPFLSAPDHDHLENSNMTTKISQIKPKKSIINVRQDEESSYSSFYSSFLKTDTGSGSNDDCNDANNKHKFQDINLYKKPRPYPIRKCDPPWLEAVSLNPELIYRYQMTVKNLEDILQSDLELLKTSNQPLLVNDQLDQLYVEMELDGLTTKLTLEEDIAPSSSSSDDESGCEHSNKLKMKNKSYSSLMMIYEEDAPFPPPMM